MIKRFTVLAKRCNWVLQMPLEKKAISELKLNMELRTQKKKLKKRESHQQEEKA